MKTVAGLLTVCLVFAALSCERDGRDSEGAPRVALLINGNLGDRSFHDSANNGMTLIREGLGLRTRVVEVGYDNNRWEPALRDLCDENFDIIVLGTWQMQEIVSRVARDYPEQKFIIYDTSVDYDGDTEGAFRNIHSIEYRQNEGSFLAGVLAASMSESGVIGFVGGMDNTVIRDFLIGYIQGAQSVNDAIRVIPSYIGNFSDAARAMELTFAQYALGADVVFAVAANAGEGVLRAAEERGRPVIGVDSDQAMLYLDSNPALAELIISSMLKRVDQSIFLAMEQAMNGTLAWGTRSVLGLRENSVGLADNPIFRRTVSQDIRNLIDDYSNRIQRGEIQVLTAFGMDQATFAGHLDAVR